MTSRLSRFESLRANNDIIYGHSAIGYRCKTTHITQLPSTSVPTTDQHHRQVEQLTYPEHGNRLSWRCKILSGLDLPEMRKELN